MADFGGSDLDAFRAEAREWLEANFPNSLADQQTAMIPGGEALTGCNESTVPSDGVSQDNGPRLKPRSSRPAALAAR